MKKIIPKCPRTSTVDFSCLQASFVAAECNVNGAERWGIGWGGSPAPAMGHCEVLHLQLQVGVLEAEQLHLLVLLLWRRPPGQPSWECHTHPGWREIPTPGARPKIKTKMIPTWGQSPQNHMFIFFDHFFVLKKCSSG